MRTIPITLLAVTLLSVVTVHADDRCKQGYVWREAFSGDHVCVTPTVRQEAAFDNSRAGSRRDPRRGDYCLQGYVWREANPNDHVCVTPATRAQARADNYAAPSRVMGGSGGGSGGPSPGSSGGTDVTIQWRAGSNGSVPRGAVLGGWEKWQSQPGSTEIRTEGPLYICRAGFNGAIYTGKIVGNACNFGAEGREQRAGRYEVMTWRASRDSLGWRRGGSNPPPDALTGGRSPAGHDVYICRIPYNGGIHPGWQVPHRDACSIGFGGAEIQRPGMAYLVPQRGRPTD
jgi:hypothetical protein